MFLAGDLGGTKTLLGLFEPTDGGLAPVRQGSFASRNYPTFEAILAEFLAGRTGPLLEGGLLRGRRDGRQRAVAS